MLTDEVGDHREEAESALRDNMNYPDGAPECVSTSLRALAEAALALDDSLRTLIHDLRAARDE